MNKNVPKLRFSGFAGEWEEKRLGEISDALTYGLNSAACNYDGINGYIRITDIDTEGNYISSNKVSPEGDFSEEYMVKEGDILFARTGASTGKIYMYKKSDGKLFYAGFLIRARINKEHDCGYVYYSMRTNRYNNWVKLMSMRSGQPGINAKEYSSYELFLPSAFEQKKLANFLSTLDSRISLQSQKVEKLEELKKGYMQKIFSQELRFKREDGSEYGEWEDVSFSELFIELSENNINNLKQYTVGKYGLKEYTSAGMKHNTDKHKAFKKNSLLLGIGIEEVAVSVDLDGCCSPVYSVFDINIKKCSSKFVGYYIKGVFNKNRGVVARKSTRRDFEFEKKEIGKLRFNLPCKEEQTKIADFLSSFDKQIEMEKKELEKMQELKKGFLQQMFL